MMPPQFAVGLFTVSLAVSAIAIACDFKWRKYPSWAHGASLLLVCFFWYLFIREQGWLANPQGHVVQLVIGVIRLVLIYKIGSLVGQVLHGTKFGGGDVRIMAVLSLLLPITPVWLNHDPTFPVTAQDIEYIRYIPLDFWANTILFWIFFIIILELLAILVWKSGKSHSVPLAPLIIAAFYATIWYGGIWRGLVEPIIPIILGG